MFNSSNIHYIFREFKFRFTFLMIKSIFRILISILFFWYCSSFAYAESGKARITHVDFTFDQSTYKIIVNYNIENYKSFQRFTIELSFRDENNNEIIPVSMKGDIGTNIKGGINKQIIWDVFNDISDVPPKLKAKVRITEIKEVFGGPSNALFSVMVPGLGDWYVKNQKKMILKPYIRTAAVYGILGYGIYQTIQIPKAKNEYLNPKENPPLTDWKTTNDKNYQIYRNHVNQSIIYTSAGITCWVADVVWVLIKGSSNARQNKNLKSTSYFSPKSVHLPVLTDVSPGFELTQIGYVNTITFSFILK